MRSDAEAPSDTTEEHEEKSLLPARRAPAVRSMAACGVVAAIFVAVGLLSREIPTWLRGGSAPWQSQSNYNCTPPPAPPNTTKIYLGNGCFWERQYAYYVVESQQFGRSGGGISSKTGYAGGNEEPGPPVCYHTSSPLHDYGALGHAEVVEVVLDDADATAQFAALAADFFGSFTGAAGSRARPDPMDVGQPYRSVVGIPGGVDGPLYPTLSAANTHGMELKAGFGSDGDDFNVVWILDSRVYPFHQAEAYHQMHSNFFQSEGMPYPPSYVNDLWEQQKQLCLVREIDGCPDGSHW